MEKSSLLIIKESVFSHHNNSEMGSAIFGYLLDNL